MEILPQTFAVCRLAALPTNLPSGVWFMASTGEEVSLVCEQAQAPHDAQKSEPGWRAFKVCGPLEFSLVGILSGISQALAEGCLSLFAVSTYDTDYILVKQEKLIKAVALLRKAGYEII